MISPRFEIKGLKQLGHALSELPDRTAKKVLRAAKKKAALPIQQDAIRRARRAVPGPTYPEIGHMADNIILKVSLTKKKGALAMIGPDKPHQYLAFQEFGTPQSPAEPVLSAALESTGTQAVDILARELGGGIEREAAKLAKENVAE